MVHFIGSDAHNTKRRSFCLEPAYEVAKKYLGADADYLVEHIGFNQFLGVHVE